MQKIVFFLFLFFLVSCTSNTIFKAPKDLIPKDTMKALMADMAIASSAKYFKNKNLEKNINYTHLVFLKYNIDSARFDRSSVYYISRIDEYAKMVDEVKIILDRQKKMYTDKKNVLDSIRQDSIKKLDTIKKLDMKKPVVMEKQEDVEEIAM